MELKPLPRVRFVEQVTPVYELKRLTEAIKGPKIFIKRDDMTELALGGNKARKLEYLIGEALDNDADCIVTGAGFQSNWCTQAVAAANQFGMKTVLVKAGPKNGYQPEIYEGNHLLHLLMGAKIEVVRPEELIVKIENIVNNLKSEGQKPYFIPPGGSTPEGSVGYVNSMLEISKQTSEQGMRVDHIIHATGSGGTQAGLLAGVKALNSSIKILGVSTGSRSIEEQTRLVMSLTIKTADLLEIKININQNDVNVFDGYAGGGYGFINKKKEEAIRLVAETEGIILDPVYTGTAMACLIDLCRKGYFRKDDVVMFLHTGGSGGLYPYGEPLKAYYEGEEPPWTIPPWHPSSTNT
jgi:D-cysteine desulfhydrase family pyridoxal phosphate-dependent enzyme